MKKAQISMNMIVYIAIALLVLVLIVAFVTGGFGEIFDKLIQEPKQDDNLILEGSVTLNVSDGFTVYNNDERNQYISLIDNKIEIRGTCWEVICDCAKNTTIPCMAYCFECREDWNI